MRTYERMRIYKHMATGIIKKNIEILYPELSYRLNGIFFKIHKERGRFCRERQYADDLEKELKNKNITYLREYRIINDKDFSGNIVDFIINECIIVDLKAKKYITKDDFYQMKRYLKSLDKRLGLIVNFQDNFIKTKRVLNNY
jgi:GxxExxY protein